MSDELKQPDLVRRLLAFSATLANEEEDMVNEAAKRIAELDAEVLKWQLACCNREDESMRYREEADKLEAQLADEKSMARSRAESIQRHASRANELEEQLAESKAAYDSLYVGYRNAESYAKDQLSAKDEEIERLERTCQEYADLRKEHEREITSLRKALEEIAATRSESCEIRAWRRCVTVAEQALNATKDLKG